MTGKQLIKLGLILTGVYYALSSIYYFSQVLSTFLTAPKDMFYSGSLIYSLYTIAIIYFFIFRTEAVIRLFRLDDKLGEAEISISENAFAPLLKLLLAFGGLWLIASHLSNFIVLLAYLVRTENKTNAAMELSHNYIDMYTSLGTIVVGVILLLNYESIARVIVRKERV